MAKKRKKKQKKTNYSGPIKLFWSLFVAGILIVASIFGSAALGFFGPMPPLEQLENPKTNLATQIISADGEILGKFFYNDNRTPISFDELPPHLVEALVATEDERFYAHSGIDFRGTFRAIAYLGKRGGASTITQQLARQLFVGVRSRNKVQAITQKIKEWVLAVKLERRYTKEEILAMYLNIYDFGYQADGIQSAAKIYFNKTPMTLSMEEAATLVGMLKNSSLFNPKRRPEMTQKRRNVVFQQMFRNKFISEKERDSLQRQPLTLDFTPDSHREGLATYFRTYVQQYMQQWVKENPKADGERYDIYRDGLRIYTTIDSRLQALGEQAMEQHMKKLQAEFFLQNTPDLNPTAPFLELREGEIDTLLERSARRSERWRALRASGKDEESIWASFKVPTPMTVFSWKGDIDTVMTPLDSMRYYKHYLRAAMMSMDPVNGHVKTWIGGFDYTHFQYDQVRQGRRQIGSTFKPFLYATAIDQLRLSPCDILPDALFCIEPMKFGNVEAWCPKNSGDKYGQMRTLKNALANSVNTVSARLMDKVGPTPVVNLAKKMGITSYLPRVPSIALGTPDISLFEMVGAYSTFANKGIYVKPITITRIEDKNGTVLFEISPETRDVISEESAFVTLNLLKGVTEGGSGQRLRHNVAEENYAYQAVVTGYPYEFTNPIAGKTGTTQNHSDGWFMGMVPNLVTGVWVGGEDRAVHFDNIAYGQGASMALPIWALFMKSVYDNPALAISQEDFEAPEVVGIPIDCVPVDPDELNRLKEKEEDLDELGF